MQAHTPISPVSLRFQDPQLEQSFIQRLNSRLHMFDISCGIALPFVAFAVAFRRCSDLLPTTWCRPLRLCRNPHLPDIPFTARPALHTAFVVHILVYAAFLTTLLTCSQAWRTRHRITIASAMRMWHYIALPCMIVLQPLEHWTCPALQGAHLHIVVITAAIVPLCHQTPFAHHMAFSVVMVMVALFSCMAPRGISAGLVDLVQNAHQHFLDGGGRAGVPAGDTWSTSWWTSLLTNTCFDNSCCKLMVWEGKVGAFVAHVVSSFNHGLLAWGGGDMQTILDTPPNAATITTALMAGHLFTTAAVSSLLYHRELGLRLSYLREHQPQAYEILLPHSPLMQGLWTMRCALLLGTMACQGVFLLWMMVHA